MEQLTTVRPLVLVLEDLHWSDPSTLDFIRAMARRRDPARLLLIGTYRPPDILLSDHPTKTLHQNLIARQQGHEIALASLTTNDIRAYLTARFDNIAPDVCDPLAELLYRHTEGNALFVVNSVNALVEQEVIVQDGEGWHVLHKGEVVDMHVPTDLQRFIVYQAERLPPEAQQVLEAASVAGGQFVATTVAAALDTETEIIERCCDDLVRRQQFLHALEVEQWPDGTWMGCYRFIHALYRETLYHRLPAASRIRYHQRIGTRLEAAYGERARDIAATLAVHFEQGWQYPAAMYYYRLAGESALQCHAPHEAITHLSNGIKMAAHTPPDVARDRHEIRLQITLGTALTATDGLASERVKDAYDRARVLSEQADEKPSLFIALGGLCGHAVVRAEHHQAREFAEQRLVLAEHAQDASMRIHAHLTLGSALFYLGELQMARRHFEQSLNLYESTHYQTIPERDVVDPRVAVLTFLSWVLWLLGYLDQARQCNRDALTYAQHLGHPHSESFALGFSAWLQHLRRNPEALEVEAQALLAMARQHGFMQWLGVGTILRGWSRFSSGQGEQGIAQIRQTLTVYRAGGNELSLSYSLSLLAEAYGQMGENDTALTTIATALEIANTHDERYYEAELHRLQGELLLQRQAANAVTDRSTTPDTAEAERCFHRALKVADQQQAKLLELRSAMSLARVWHQRGHRTQARDLVSGLYEWFDEGGDTTDLQEASSLLRTWA